MSTNRDDYEAAVRRLKAQIADDLRRRDKEAHNSQQWMNFDNIAVAHRQELVDTAMAFRRTLAEEIIRAFI
ncbi:MAG TPA: hypothetical protein VGU20_30925 [Stellaceae bacterium]|nr:hypothetical protein [Terriglobia bacterium]HEV2551764.1 hypothetical protein [Stellaceae bacterium]